MELREALSAAIEYEHRIRDHYAGAATKALDEKAKKIFATLAREEQGHVTYLESRLAEWTKTGTVNDAELPSLLPPPTWLQAEAAKLAGVAAGHPVPLGTEMELMKVALELELTTSAFYEDLVARLEPRFAHLFARFLEIERGHVAIVQAEINALAGLGHWFDFMEFSLEAQ
jgi:rubrerythrin